MIIFNSPTNPTGHVATREEVEGIAKLAAERMLFWSATKFTDLSVTASSILLPNSIPQAIVLDGFSKSHGMPGWRVGFAHGPGRNDPNNA